MAHEGMEPGNCEKVHEVRREPGSCCERLMKAGGNLKVVKLLMKATTLVFIRYFTKLGFPNSISELKCEKSVIEYLYLDFFLNLRNIFWVLLIVIKPFDLRPLK